MRIYTRAGDEGQTGLLYGGRVSKTDPKCEAYGTTDEAVSTMGLARALSQDARVKEILLETQRQLFTVGAELATDRENYHHLLTHGTIVSSDMVARLEQLIDELMDKVDMPAAFIVPGASPASSALDVARTILRTAERRIVGLHEQGQLLNPEIMRYVNRLSDLLFALARYEDRALPFELVTGEQQ